MDRGAGGFQLLRADRRGKVNDKEALLLRNQLFQPIKIEMSTVEDIRQALRAIYATTNLRLFMLNHSPSLTPVLPGFNALENGLVTLKQYFINTYGDQITDQQRSELDNMTDGITQRTQALAVPPAPAAPAAGGGRRTRKQRKSRKNRKVRYNGK